jgi:hypothetical protein
VMALLQKRGLQLTEEQQIFSSCQDISLLQMWLLRALILQDEGEAKPVSWEDIVLRIGEPQKGPRLIVMAYCQDSGYSDHLEPAQDHIARRLADAGGSAVIGMQDAITTGAIKKIMPVCFKQLLLHGQIDLALAPVLAG